MSNLMGACSAAPRGDRWKVSPGGLPFCACALWPWVGALMSKQWNSAVTFFFFGVYVQKGLPHEVGHRPGVTPVSL